MNIHVPNKRLKKLTVDGYRDGAQIAFCERCNFQYEPDTCGKSQCPECGRQLLVIRNSPELREIATGPIR